MASQIIEQKPAVKVSSHPRIDGRERTTGTAKYAADWKMPGMLYARVLTSSVSHGSVKKINTLRAKNFPGVEAVITCLDDGTIWHGGDRDHERRVLPDLVKFAGETIAAIAATNRRVAEEALQAIEVEYEELPAVISIEEAMKTDAPKVWENGNITPPMGRSFGDMESCFLRADMTFEAVYSTSRVCRAQLELPASLAWWDGDMLTSVITTQTLHSSRQTLSADLGIPLDKVRTISMYKGGGFGGGGSTNFDLIAALLAKKSRKPVMVEYSREQDFVGTHSRWATSQHLRAAFSKSEGKLLALDLKAHCDIGAYLRYRPGLSVVDGPDTYYSWEAWRSGVYGVYTNTPASGYVRAPAGPASNFAVESFVDEIAHKLAMNPLELRLRNAVTTVHGVEHLTSNGLEDCMISGSEKFGWRESWRPAPSELISKDDETVRGVGMAVGSWHSLLVPGQARIRIGSDGITEVYVGIVDIGTGAKTTMAMIAAKVLDLPLESIKVISGDTSTTPWARGEVGSMTTGSTGTAVRVAASALREKMLTLASKKLGTSDLEMHEGCVLSRNGFGRGLPISELILDTGQDFMEEIASTNPTLPEHLERLSFTAHFAEVEVDVGTGVVRVTRYVASQDSGEIVNRLTAESQVRGSVVMGIGMALSENLLIDSDFGTVKNPSFMNYRLPNHVSIPKIDVIFSAVKDPYGPKSLGETSMVPVPAAIGNAIFNATGKRFRKIPFTPEQVFRAVG
jgi:xanthine dehydrogenase molybdenum-binding subunit